MSYYYICILSSYIYIYITKQQHAIINVQCTDNLEGTMISDTPLVIGTFSFPTRIMYLVKTIYVLHSQFNSISLMLWSIHFLNSQRMLMSRVALQKQFACCKGKQYSIYCLSCHILRCFWVSFLN